MKESDKKKKLDEYQEVLDGLCSKNNEIHHAVLLIAHPKKNGGEKFEVGIVMNNATTDTMIKLLEQTIEELKKQNSHTSERTH